MPVVIVALVFVGALCLLNLVLNVGIIKRLRDQAEILNRNGNSGPGATLGMNEEVGTFSTITEDGELVDHASLYQGDTLVAFFSPTCSPCRAKLPHFVEFAATFPGGREKVLATVVGEAADTADMVERLRPVARVVREDSNKGAVSTAFALQAFPAILVVSPSNEHGRPIITADNLDRDLPVPAT
ncbi:hypothetical protein ADK38_03965 [Streptomyces varsoviensis]|uniref:Thioredoxin domain-containing protein n=1 Tax=Streptomyces varsoviensis TaxID=67373 RepID=A0ABR5JCX9_9ACTN|nr:hypothetical protein ADK38_03965 [Streptomyces varsoviensis]